MANSKMPGKKIEIREGDYSHYSDHDKLIDEAKKAGKYCVRTDADAEGIGYLGMDDLDRLRRQKIK